MLTLLLLQFKLTEILDKTLFFFFFNIQPNYTAVKGNHYARNSEGSPVETEAELLLRELGPTQVIGTKVSMLMLGKVWVPNSDNYRELKLGHLHGPSNWNRLSIPERRAEKFQQVVYTRPYPEASLSTLAEDGNQHETGI
jgi:hypothetical protein